MKRGLKQTGFTIVELLIVIVVIGILAALTIVAFNGVKDRANDSAAKSAAIQATKKMETAKVTNGEQYPTSLAAAEIPNLDNVYQYSGTATTYCITSTVGSKSYRVSESTTTPVAGGCAGHGVGGVAAVTNLLTNPSFAVGLAGWSGTSGAAISRVTTPWVLDNGALQVTPTAQDSYAYADIPAVAGQVYTVLGTVRLEAPQTGTFQGTTQQRNIFFEFRNSSGGYTGSGGGTSTVQANAVGTYAHRAVGTAPAATTTLRIRLYNGATTGGGSVFWDRIMAVDGNYSGNYGDGRTTDWVWNGTADSATSTGPSQ